MGERRRPAVAAVLALAVAGLGHAYLRRWGRAAAWFLTIVISGVVLMGVFASPDANVWELPLTVLGPLVGLFVLSAVDAYRLAARASAAPERGDAEEVAARASAAPERGDAEEVAAEDELPQCPNCGREVDPDLDFCHWCTQRLSFDGESDGAREPSSGRE